MNKFIHFALLASALATGPAFAQADSERFNPTQPGIAHPEVDTPAYGNSGWTLEQDLYNGGRPIVAPSQGRRALERRASPYPRTSRDRDGDGVPNRRDRYPDDRRYR